MVGPHPPSPRPSFPDSPVRFLLKRPLLLWVLVWLVLALMTGVALSSLLSPGLRLQESSAEIASQPEDQELKSTDSPGVNSESQSIEATPPILATQVASPPRDDRMVRTLWLAGGLTLVGTLGSLLLLKQINQTKSYKVVRRSGRRSPTSHYPFVEKTPKVSRSPGVPPQKVSSKVAPKAVSPAQVPLPRDPNRVLPPRSSEGVAINPLTQVRQGQPVTSKRRRRAGYQPRVTVVPPEQSHALDLRGQVNLAEMVDIRKRRANYS